MPGARKPRRWIWILGICAALFVGIGVWFRDRPEARQRIANGRAGHRDRVGSLTVNAGEFVEISGDCVWTKVG